MNIINKIKRKVKYWYYDMLYIRACKKVGEYYYYDDDKYEHWVTLRCYYGKKCLNYEL